MAETFFGDSWQLEIMKKSHILRCCYCKSWFRAQKPWKPWKQKKLFFGRSDFIDVFIKKLAYIWFYKLVSSYVLVPGTARYLKGYWRYGSRKVWDVQSRTNFIWPRMTTIFYVLNERNVAVVLMYFGPKYVCERWNMAENVFSFSYTTKTAAGHRWSQLVTSGHTW